MKCKPVEEPRSMPRKGSSFESKERAASPRLSAIALLLLCCLLLLCVLCSEWTLLVRFRQSEAQLQVPVDKKVDRLGHVSPASVSSTCPQSVLSRTDCHPDPVASERSCLARGCCWQLANRTVFGIGVPYCFFPSDYPGYRVTSESAASWGWRLLLQKTATSFVPDEILQLQADIILYDEQTVRVKIYDPTTARFEVPIPLSRGPSSPGHYDFAVNYTLDPFSFQVTRKSSGQVLWDSSVAPLLFGDQFVEMSSRLPSKFVYGLGEHETSFLLSVDWTRLAFWSRDQPPSEDSNLYGVHPFYLNLEPSGDSNGVFLLNSNALEVILQPLPAITYRSIGGILDVFVFTGPSPSAVVSQYVGLIGSPMLPPYWALGFHLCRWGYGGSAGLSAVINRTRSGDFPYEAQWTDIDYMRSFLDWTYDTANYSALPAIVSDLHAHGQHYVIIVDPGISNVQPAGSYPPYDRGVEEDIFIKEASGSKPIVGVVWPGTTVFPDFSHPSSASWWLEMASAFHALLPFDGLWTDMNEPSNFAPGSLLGCTGDKYDDPPYVPGVLGATLFSKTLCPSARQHASLHYNVHSLFGHLEAVASNQALRSIRALRPLVISRSTFPGSGQHAGHWLGDNRSEWAHLYASIPGVLSFNLFGIPLVGPDVCGFMGDTSDELCTRWFQLAVFYPFTRNHNSIGNRDQDPASFPPAVQDNIRLHLRLRYLLLPYLYTLFYESHVLNGTVVRPLFFEFAQDKATWAIDRQLLFGSALLVSPVLDAGATRVDAYFPDEAWYDLYNGTRLSAPGTLSLDAPLERINVHLRGGSVLPTQQAAVTTQLSRLNPFGLLVALKEGSSSRGSLYWDDGDSLDSLESGAFNLLSWTATDADGPAASGQLTWTLLHAGYPTPMPLASIRLYGMQATPTAFFVDGVQTPFRADNDTWLLEGLRVDLLQPVLVSWE